MAVNAVALTGAVAGVQALRHTPAGIPLQNFRLIHRSRQIEAGHERLVECEIAVVALGEAALAIADMRDGDSVRVEGFLARRSRVSAQPILHVTRTERVKDTHHGENGTEQG